ncbi:MAG: hypothetical protein ACXVB9_20530 [Bdellovibrionota bacterium]
MKKLAPIFLLAALQACASSAQNKQLDAKVAAETDVPSGKALNEKESKIVSNTSGLSADQKEKLDALRQHVHDKLSAIAAESVKLRSVLIKDVLTDKPNHKEISAVKHRLAKLSDQRLDTIFDAANQTNELLGRNGMLREAMDIQFLEDNFNAY